MLNALNTKRSLDILIWYLYLYTAESYFSKNYFIFFFSNFFENFFTPGWKPIFGISHSKKIEFGKGGKYQHGINFNIGPKPKFQPDLESLEFNALQDRQRTKRVLKSMTKPYFRRGRHNYNRL